MSFTTGVTSGCTFASTNGTYGTYGGLDIIQIGNSLFITDTDPMGDSCAVNVTLSQRGSYYDGIGTFSCNYGVSGTVRMFDARKIDDFFTFEQETQATSGETRRRQAKVAAIQY